MKNHKITHQLKKTGKRTITLLVAMFLIILNAMAQHTNNNDGNLRSAIGQKWSSFMIVAGSIIVIDLVIGVIMVAAARNDEEKFKKRLVTFLISLLVLIIAISLVNWVYNQIANTASPMGS